MRELLADSLVRIGLREAWEDSRPGDTGGHEEGGFVLQNKQGALSVLRWPTGLQDEILVPPHVGAIVEGLRVVAMFHTHPNTGRDYLQRPSETDRAAVVEDPDLKSSWYQGEYVVSAVLIYGIHPDGRVEELGRREDLLGDIV